MTEQEWWDLVAANWDGILAFCEQYLPMDSCQDCDGNDTPKTVREQIIQSYERRDYILSRFLGEAWWRAEEKSSRPHPMFSVIDKLYNEEPNWKEQEKEMASPLSGALARLKRK